MTETELEKGYEKAAQIICKQGPMPLPVGPTTIAILKEVIEDKGEELGLIHAFKQKASQTMEELKESTGFPEERIERAAASLARKGMIFNQPNSKGTMVYRLLPLMLVGLMEYTFMGELEGNEKEQRLAELFEGLLAEVTEKVQANYDNLLPLFRQAPPVDRTVPMERTEQGTDIKTIPLDRKVEVPEEAILPNQSVEDIIEKFDEIAVGRCFCRQRRSMLGEPCELDAPMMNCFTFGKSARHTTAQGFARKVTKEEALGIMREAEEAGLIHKAFHPGSNESRPETSICNCCKDCCDTLRAWRKGTMPLINSTYYLSVIDEEVCTGCGTCLELCPTEAIRLNREGTAEREESLCLGCGICARSCPEGAVSLQEGLRRVFVPPPRRRP